MSDTSVPISPSEMDRKLLLDTLDNMDVVRSGGKVVQGLVNRRSREKDNAEDINPAFPTDISEDADLSQIQKRAALNLLIREESSGGQNLGLENIGNTVGRYHIQKDKAALINPEIKDMTMTEYHRYILNNPEAEEELVSKYIDTEINKMLKNKGVDTSKLKHNEYASIVSNLYNKGNQPKLLESAAKLTNFRSNNPRDKRFTETPYFEETKNKNQNVNQSAPIKDTGANIPLPEDKSKFPEERVIDLPPEEENKYEGVPFLHYKSIQKLLGLAEGGAVPMKEQMSMFENGGLMDEGGTVDPVSGNDVPPGSTQEEVRDDIPAQLSEGEFVFPADVVRYIGLGNLMRMRQEAKMGLKIMDEMGQMGNSEEATIPDDLPFDINDLDMEDEIDDNSEAREMQVGGFVLPTTAATQQQQQMGISGFQQAAAPTTGVSTLPQAASQQFVQPVRPQQAAVPTMQAYKPAEVPTFTQIVGENPGQYDEMREYKNEAGEVRMIPFKAGQPIYPIPEGFTFVDPEATKTEEVTTTPTTPQTTSVREDELTDREDADERRRQAEIDKYGNTTAKIGLKDFFGEGKDYIYGVNYLEGFAPGIAGMGQVITGNIPDNAKIMLKNGDDEILLTGEEYKKFSSVVKAPGTDYSDIMDLMEEGRANALAAKDEKRNKQLEELARLEKSEERSSLIRTLQEERNTKKEQKKLAEAQAKAAAAAKKSANQLYEKNIEQQQRNQQEDDDEPSYSKPTEYTMDTGFQDFTDFGGSSGPMAKGGLASKPKPKAKKKMKRGGLASKK